MYRSEKQYEHGGIGAGWLALDVVVEANARLFFHFQFHRCGHSLLCVHAACMGVDCVTVNGCIPD